MPLDPSIIGSFRPPEVMSPVNAMAQMYQLRTLQGESEKNQLAMEKSRRDMEREQTVNRLMSAAGGNEQDFLRGLERSNLGSMVPDYKEKFAKANEATYKAGQERFKYVTEFMKNTRAHLNKIKTVEDAKAWSASHHADPIMGALLASQGITQEKSFADIDEAWANNTQNDWLLKAAEGTDQFATRLQMGAVQHEFDKIKSDQPGTVDKNGVVQVIGNPVQDLHLMAKIALDKGYPELGKHLLEQAKELDMSQDRRRTTDSGNYGLDLEAKRVALEATRVEMERQRMIREEAKSKQSDNEIAHVIPGEGPNVTLVSKTGQVIQPSSKIIARPSATYEKAEAQRKQITRDLEQAIFEVEAAVKPGGLIDQSTGSGLGRGRDLVARGVGIATSGDIAIGKLKPIADLVLKLVPRFEGPQSNADTQSYQQAAGQLADPTMPNKIRKEAANVIIRLMKNRKNQFVSQDMINTPAASGASASGATDVRRQADEILKAK